MILQSLLVDPAFYVVILLVIILMILFISNIIREKLNCIIYNKSKNCIIRKNTINFYGIYRGQLIFQAKTFFNKTILLKKIKDPISNKTRKFEVLSEIDIDLFKKEKEKETKK